MPIFANRSKLLLSIRGGSKYFYTIPGVYSFGDMRRICGLFVGGNTINVLSLLFCILVVFVLLECCGLPHLSITNSNGDFSICCDMNRLIYSYFANLLQLLLYPIRCPLFAVSIDWLYITRYARLLLN